MASVLQRTGAYVNVVLKKLKPKVNWVRSIRHVGRDWRRNFRAGDTLPDLVTSAWKQILREKHLPLADVRDDSALSCALLELLCAADEACAGIGIVNELAVAGDKFEAEWARVLFFNKGSTLCQEVGADRAVVLPKVHTPRSGMTLRSLTHNLALYQPGDSHSSVAFCCHASRETTIWNVSPIAMASPNHNHVFQRVGRNSACDACGIRILHM